MGRDREAESGYVPKLWGVAECKVQGTLTPEEMQSLIDDIGGQAADGFGESFEQHEIQAGGLEIYAHLYQSKDWTIMPEKDRFDPDFSQKLPDFCWSTLPSDGTGEHHPEPEGPGVGPADPPGEGLRPL